MLDDVGDWVQAHKVPAALIGGTGLALVFAAFSHLRAKRTPAAATLPAGWTVGALTAPMTGGTQVTGPYDPNLYLPYLTGDPGGSSTPVFASGGPVTPDPSVPTVVHLAPPPTPSPTPPPAQTIPVAIPQFDSGTQNILGTVNVSNPAGSADALASSSYTPSQSDYLSERIGGITRQTVALQGGGSYTVDNTNVGSGPVVPLAQRIRDERYDASGRVIY